MVISEAVAAAFFAAMAFVHDPGLLIALAFGSAIAELPFFSASRAAIPNLVEGEDDISWANSLVTVGVNAGIAIGPLIGGVLLGLATAQWVFGINSVSFVVSLLITLSVRGRFQQERVASDEHRGLAAGLTFLRQDPVLLRMCAAWFVFLLGMGMGMVADAPYADGFGAGGMGFGLLIACWGTGSVIGSATGRWMNARTEPVWLVIGAFGVAIAAFGVGFAPVFPFALVCLFVMGTCDGLTIVSENGIMQRRTAGRRAEPRDGRVRGPALDRARRRLPARRSRAERRRAEVGLPDRRRLRAGRGASCCCRCCACARPPRNPSPPAMRRAPPSEALSVPDHVG